LRGRQRHALRGLLLQVPPQSSGQRLNKHGLQWLLRQRGDLHGLHGLRRLLRLRASTHIFRGLLRRRGNKHVLRGLLRRRGNKHILRGLLRLRGSNSERCRVRPTPLHLGERGTFQLEGDADRLNRGASRIVRRAYCGGIRRPGVIRWGLQVRSMLYLPSVKLGGRSRRGDCGYDLVPKRVDHGTPRD